MKILVVGLRKEQNTFLRNRFKGFSIDALDDGMKHHKAKKNAKYYDLVISLTKFTNHTTHQHYRSHPGYHMISGGYSSVTSMLSSLST